MPRVINGNRIITEPGTPLRITDPGVMVRGWVTAFPTNTTVIMLGGEPGAQYGVTPYRRTMNGPVATSAAFEGTPLNPGETFPVQLDLAMWWIDTLTDNDGVSWSGITND